MSTGARRNAAYAEGLSEATWLVALVAVPLFFNTHSSRVFEADKATLVRCLALLALLALAVAPRRVSGPEGRVAGPRALVARPLVRPALAFVGAAFVTTIFSVAPRISLLGSYHRLQGLATTLAYVVLAGTVAATVRRREQVERALTAAILGSLPVALYGILQHFGCDPLPWASETRRRVIGTAGHPTALGSYLALIIPLVLGRLTLAWRERAAETWLRQAGYVLILAVDLAALSFTGSRGAVLGLMAALFVFFVLLPLREGRPFRALGGAALGAVVVAFLLLLNVPHGPMEGLRQGRLGRFAELLEKDTGTVRGRMLIWGAILELMTREKPLSLGDGQEDPWSHVRWLVGYGQETLSLVFPQVAPPELAGLEDPGLGTDRAHNETLDALVSGGAVGLLAYLALFLTVLCWGGKWSALPHGTPATLALSNAACGLIVATLLAAWQGPGFFFVGLPLGMVLGLAGLSTLSAWKAARQEQRARRDSLPTRARGVRGGRRSPPWLNRKPHGVKEAQDAGRGVALVSLFAALVGHLVETQFGVSTTTTRMFFWVFLALLWVLGERRAQGDVAAPRNSERQRREAAEPRATRVGGNTDASSWGRSVALTSVLLWVLAYDFIRGSGAPPAGTDPAAPLSLFLLGLLGLTVALAVCLADSPFRAQGSQGRERAPCPDSSRSDFEGDVSWRGITPFGDGSLRVVGAGVVFGVVPLLLILSIRLVQADMIYRAAKTLADLGDMERGQALFDRAVSLCGWEDFYPREWGATLAQSAAVVLDEAKRDRLFAQGHRSLMEAERTVPLSPETAAALARLQLTWAAVSSEPPLRRRRAREAETAYEDALALKPHDPDLWNEAAALALDFLDRPNLAAARIARSLALDPYRESTHLLKEQLEARRRRPF